MSVHQRPSVVRIPIAGFLAWLIPGLGHFFLGYRSHGVILLVTITVTFWTGVAVGGVRSTVDPVGRKLWFMAQLCTAGNTMAGYALNRSLSPDPPSSSKRYTSKHWESADVGIHYTGVAGLLNLLVIFDAMARADPSFQSGGKRRNPPGPPQ